MRIFKFLVLTAVAGFCFMAATPKAQAQITITFGTEPSCPYGYYDYAPYNCSPYGYYGPEWFNGGVFIGAGHWFHGSNDFHGSVDNHYDPQHGYKGATPNRGEAPTRNDHPQIKGNEVRDGRGHGDGDKH
jgi:hypothetical protein